MPHDARTVAGLLPGANSYRRRAHTPGSSSFVGVVISFVLVLGCCTAAAAGFDGSLNREWYSSERFSKERANTKAAQGLPACLELRSTARPFLYPRTYITGGMAQQERV